MAGRQKRIHHLDLQLEAILDAMILASREPDPEQRAERLAVVERAFTAYHEEHRAMLARPRLRVLPGGAGAVAVAMWSWLRDAARAHPQVTAGTAVAAATAVTVGLLVSTPWRGQVDRGQGPPVAAPSATAPPSSGTPSPHPSQSLLPSPPVSSPASSGSPGPSVAPTPTSVPSAPVTVLGSAAPEVPSESPPLADSTAPEVPPDEGDEDPPGDDDDPMEEPAPPSREPCLVDAGLPLLDVRIGSLLCL